MMPGWWDQNKESLEQLAQTATRMVNPQFDAQQALMQSIRTNPQNMQVAIDTASLNPDMFAQMFGPRMLQQVSRMGTPSTNARIEQTGREIGGMAPESVPNTVLAQAAAGKMGAQRPGEVKREGLVIAGEEQRQNIAQYNFTREQLDNSMADPIRRNMLMNTRRAIEENPQAGLIDPERLALDTINGRFRTSPEESARHARMLTSLAATAPDVYKMYQYFLGEFADQVKQSEQWRREDARINLQIGREDNAERRAAMQWARQQTARTGLPIEKLFNYAMLEDEPEVAAFFVGDEAAEQQRTRIRAMGGLAETISKYVKAKGSARQLLKTPTELAMSELVGRPVTIEKISENWISSSTEFTVDGVKVNGEQLHEMMSNPQEYRELQDLATRAESVPLEQLPNLIAGLSLQVVAGEITQQQADARRAKLEEIQRRKTQEAAMNQRAEAQRK